MKKKIVKRESRLELMNIKLSAEDHAKIKAKAKKYAQGNVSAYLRHMAILCSPKPGSRIQLRLSHKHAIKVKPSKVKAKPKKAKRAKVK